MRIVHVVSYMSDDGAYGGPASVAEDQCRSLAARGHDVTLLAAAPTSETCRDSIHGYQRVLFPARRVGGPSTTSFAFMSSPRMLRSLRGPKTFDVAHVHMARDLVTLPAAWLLSRKMPMVIQTHGMIDRSPRHLAHLLDATITRRMLRRAAEVLSLTRDEDEELHSLEPRAQVRRTANGIDIDLGPPIDERPLHVLFAARLHSRKRPMTFIAAAERVAEVHSTATFTLLGPDEGELPAVLEALERSTFKDRIHYGGAVSRDAVRDQLRQSSAYVLPSQGEVFPVTVLEAWAAGTPVITTTSSGIAGISTEHELAIVTDGTVEDLSQSMIQLLSSAKQRALLRMNALDYVHANLSTETIAMNLEKSYERAGRK